jgi:hypothetical protein
MTVSVKIVKDDEAPEGFVEKKDQIYDLLLGTSFDLGISILSSCLFTLLNKSIDLQTLEESEYIISTIKSTFDSVFSEILENKKRERIIMESTKRVVKVNEDQLDTDSKELIEKIYTLIMNKPEELSLSVLGSCFFTILNHSRYRVTLEEYERIISDSKSLFSDYFDEALEKKKRESESE